ncbi:hypothetical protein V4890_17735 [Ralstonia solanacearum species complex bacterium KE056]|uniref:hypothetical protein n=1 Tax=Ralstonia solanacearum species complex bacterium KE056 TaxID=3119585 RepID=UPI002FC36856
MMNRIGSSTSTSTPNLARENSLERLDTAIGDLQQARRDAVKRNPALALFSSRNNNTDSLLEQASSLSANRHRTAGKSKNDATPDSQGLIDGLNSLAKAWMKA